MPGGGVYGVVGHFEHRSYKSVSWFDKLLENSSLVLGFRLLHFTNKFPDLAAQTPTLNSFKTFVETLANPDMAKVFNLKTEVCLNPVYSFDLLN